MVRALMGALVAVGEGRRDPQWPRDVLNGLVRDPGVQVMPARGLCLEQVTYPSAGALAARAAVTRRLRTPVDVPPAGAADGSDPSIG